MVTEEYVGTVEGYDKRTHHAYIHLTRGTLHRGDLVHFKGRGVDEDQRLTHLEHDHAPVDEAHQGEDVEAAVRRPLLGRVRVFVVRDPYQGGEGAALQALFPDG